MMPRHTSHRFLVTAFLVSAMFATPARGDDSDLKFSGENRGTAARYAEACKHLEEKQWSQAIEELQSILANADSDLIPISPSQSVSARHLCQVRLAGLPTEALRLYRQRYETQAAKKLQTALAEGDTAPLRKMVEEAFCTRAAEKAIDRLGDLAFERGRFDEAEEWWRLLAPLPDAYREKATHGFALVYPDLGLDPARLQAKQLLARLFHNTDDEWRTALGAYRQRHGKAEGTLAGRKGRYADLLLAVAEERKKQGHEERADWPTFAGDPSRNRVISASEDILDRLSSLCREGPTWTFDLQKGTRQEKADLSPALNAEQARTLAFYPIIVGSQVVVADARNVTAYDVRTGKSELWYDAAEFKDGVNPKLQLPAPPDLRYTLTATGDRIYTRLGAQDIGLETPPPAPRFGMERKPRRDNDTFLACLGRQADAARKHLRWEERADNRTNTFFEGAPLAAGGQVWIAATRYENNQCHHAIVCYPDDDTAKPPLWRREVSSVAAKVDEFRARHHLLTRAGTQIVFCTHDGAVAALDAATGRTNWAVRYPKRTLDREEPEPELRELAPVVFAAGRLYVAPSDSDTLLCLDAASGRTLWELEPLRVVHLLGVGQGRLIFTTPGGIRGVDAATGKPIWSVPENGGGSSLLDGLTPSGRGLLIGDLVLFPTTRPCDDAALDPAPVVYALRQYDGRPADSPANLHHLPSGNLAYANGILVVADRRTLSIFMPPRLLLNARQAAVQREPDSAKALLDLARALADAGKDDEALRTFRQVEEILRRSTKRAEKKLLVKSFIAEQDLLLKKARRDAEQERWEETETALKRAAALPLPPRYRLHALLRAAYIWQETKQTERADAVWDTIRGDERLLAIPVMDHQGRSVSLSSSAMRRGTRNPALPFASRRNEMPSLPLYRAWHVSLRADERIVASTSEYLLIGAADKRLACRLASTGESRWTCALPFAPRWASESADMLVVAGDNGIAGLRRDDGTSIWHFDSPESGYYPHESRDALRVVLNALPPERLTAFRLKAGRVFFLQGQRRFFALNAANGAVLWERWAPDAALSLPYPRSRFSPHYYVSAETVLVQASRRRWLLDAAGGRQIHEATDDRELWPRPPLELDENTLCLAPDNRHVEALETKTGRTLWTYRPSGGTTLSGEPASVLGRGAVLLYCQPLNIGYSLQRLDPASGKPLWSHPPLLTAKSLKWDDWSFDNEAFYGMEDDTLVARSLTNGAILWRRPLLGFTSWRTQRIGTYLAVSPCSTVEWKWRFLLGRDALCPLYCHDPKTGQPIQRFAFRLEGPPLAIGFRDRTKTNEVGPMVRLDSLHPFVAVGGDIWGLTANEDR